MEKAMRLIACKHCGWTERPHHSRSLIPADQAACVSINFDTSLDTPHPYQLMNLRLTGGHETPPNIPEFSRRIGYSRRWQME
jgi:hypothetical protein